ncbi:MAG: hypothetical protein SO031_10480, partial [Candidatus Ventricola sp.]|nr:hypothetical protein [Candidatus Ventricola sp.]
MVRLSWGRRPQTPAGDLSTDPFFASRCFKHLPRDELRSSAKGSNSQSRNLKNSIFTELREIFKAAHTAPGPGPQSWSFHGGLGVQWDVGGKSKSLLIPLGPAQRASPEDGNLQSFLVSITSLLLRNNINLPDLIQLLIKLKQLL